MVSNTSLLKLSWHIPQAKVNFFLFSKAFWALMKKFCEFLCSKLFSFYIGAIMSNLYFLDVFLVWLLHKSMSTLANSSSIHIIQSNNFCEKYNWQSRSEWASLDSSINPIRIIRVSSSNMCTLRGRTLLQAPSVPGKKGIGSHWVQNWSSLVCNLNQI